MAAEESNSARTNRQLCRLSKKNLGPEPVIKIMKWGRSGWLIPYFLIIWKAAAENPDTRSGPASLLFSKQKWPQKWHIKGVIELRAEELLSLILEKLKTHGQWERGECRFLEGLFTGKIMQNISNDQRFSGQVFLFALKVTGSQLVRVRASSHESDWPDMTPWSTWSRVPVGQEMIKVPLQYWQGTLIISVPWLPWEASQLFILFVTKLGKPFT